MLIALACLVLLTVTTDIGGGDVKLIAVLILSQGSNWIRPQSIPIALLSAVALMLWPFLTNRRMPARVPLAPVILTPMALYYLAI